LAEVLGLLERAGMPRSGRPAVEGLACVVSVDSLDGVDWVDGVESVEGFSCVPGVLGTEGD
jgi:hypothetical protein